MITLARESRGMSQSELAKRLNMSQGKLSKIENGMLTVSENELLKISEVLNYRISFFQRNERIYGVGLSEFFHRKRQSVPQKKLSKIYAKIEIRRMEIATLLKSVDIGQTNFFNIDPDEYNGDIETIAQVVRAAWRIPRGPIDNVVSVIEEAGGIVIPFDFEDAKIDAISVGHPGLPPLFFVNFNRPMDRIRFTLCHEIGHTIMHRIPPSDNSDIENQADRFAAEFLMPREEIAHDLNNLSLKKLASLKPYWKVSMAALLKRASDIGKITERQARYLWTQMGKAGYRTQEPVELKIPDEKPWLLKEIINVFQNELKYKTTDISEALSLSENEFRSIYLQQNSHLRLVE